MQKVEKTHMSFNGWMNKPNVMCKTMEYYKALKRNKFWYMNVEDIKPSKISKTQKNILNIV
jgi:hypothetical protein